MCFRTFKCNCLQPMLFKLLNLWTLPGHNGAHNVIVEDVSCLRELVITSFCEEDPPYLG